MKRGSWTGIFSAFKENFWGCQLLNHVEENTSCVKHALHRVLWYLAKIIRGRGCSVESACTSRSVISLLSFSNPFLRLSSSFKVIVLLLLYSTWNQTKIIWSYFSLTWTWTYFWIQALIWLDAKAAVFEKETCDKKLFYRNPQLRYQTKQSDPCAHGVQSLGGDVPP